MIRIRSVVTALGEHRRQLIAALVLGALAYLVLRGCIPGFSGSLLPPSIQDSIIRHYVQCLQDIPIWPGEVRQPTCGQAAITTVAKGTVPPEERTTGVTQAVCYKVKFQNPFWGEVGSQTHEMASYSRTISKVAILQGGTWQTFPDQEDLDLQRWQRYACPEPYEMTTGAVGRGQ